MTLAFVAAGCGSTEKDTGAGLPPGFPQEPMTAQPSEDRSVEESLTQFVRESRVVDGRRVVELELENRSGVPVAFAWSVEWMDRGGERVLDLEAAWTPLHLRAGERAPLELTAPAASAESWRLVAVTLTKEG